VTMIRTTFATSLAAALMILAAVPPTAAGDLTARTSSAQSIHKRPGGNYPVVGRLEAQERVLVDRCTPRQAWCKIRQLDGGPSGWVSGDYLIGSAAKNAAS
jgi:uncharacterized protein YraI